MGHRQTNALEVNKMKQDKYDVVTIGSGIGGMCAAALLAHGGYKTLVVEKLPLIGGRCSTMDYKGFKINNGAIGFPIGGTVHQVFQKVGAAFDVHTLDRIVYRVAGKDYELPPKGGLNWLISQASKDQAEAERVMGVLRKAFTWQPPSGAISFRDWLLQYTQNDRILGIFQALVPALMLVNSWELPAEAVIRFLELARNLRSSGFAPHGTKSLMESLASIVRSKGGDVWTHCAAKQILVTNAVAKGVLVEKEGKELEIAAQAVISNTGPRRTVELVGSENFDKGYLRELQETVRPAPLVWIQTAINNPTFDHPGSLVLTGTRRVNLTVCLSLICPEVAPEGKHLLLSGSAPSSSLPPFDFRKEIELHIMDLKDNFPEFDKYGEILLASCYQGEWPGVRTWPGYEMPQKTSVENLYNVGDAVGLPGVAATPAAAESAKLVVEDIKKRIKPG
jgi:phytoene dehydrogenase-like protein